MKGHKAFFKKKNNNKKTPKKQRLQFTGAGGYGELQLKVNWASSTTACRHSNNVILDVVSGETSWVCFLVTGKASEGGCHPADNDHEVIRVHDLKGRRKGEEQ